MGLVLLPYPAEQAAHPGYFNPTAAGLSSGELQAEAEGIASRVGKTLAESRKAFVLITPYRLNDILMNALANRITVQQSDKTVYQESLINTPVGILECLPKRGNVAKPPSTEEFSTKKLFE
jgi:hypothetical protein